MREGEYAEERMERQKMTKKVTVQITGTQRLTFEKDEEEERTQQVWTGIYSCRNGKHFVIYEEDDGEGHRTQNTIKADRDGFEITKRGAGCTYLVFQPGRQHVCSYETPFGPLPLQLKTRTVEMELPGDDGGAPGSLRLRLTACYVLEWDKQTAAVCEVCIHVCEA